MDPTTLKTVIGLVGVVGGAIIGGLFAAYNARQKLREIEVQHSHQLHENYLKNARCYIKSVYIPISIEQSKLSRAYFSYRKSLAAGDDDNLSKNQFIEDISSYSQSIDLLISRGAGAFLTTELENKLLEFGSFFAESALTSESIRKVIVEYGISFLGSNTSRETRISGKAATFWQGKFGFSQFGVSVRFNGNMLLAASLESDDFDDKSLN